MSERPAETRRAHARALLVVLVLVGTVAYSGHRHLNAPWIQGDEYIFIAGNLDVTRVSGWGDAVGALAVFAKRHEDLYQPFTIWTYAVQWNAPPEVRVALIRATDVALQAINGLLVWWVVATLLRRLAGAHSHLARDFGAAVALIWALHPMLVSIYAADMGRTHLLSVLFAMLGVLAQVRACATPRPLAWTVATVLLVILAMLNKVIPAWFVVVFALDAVLLGVRGALRSPRGWLALLACVALSAVNFHATRESLMFEATTLTLFGDPLSRAALAAFLSLRNFLLPGPQIATNYLPDPQTGWTYLPVILGAAALAVLALAALVAARSPRHRLTALGLLWFLVTWIPVSGIVGARVASAQDRYFYLPSIGLLLAIASLMLSLRRTKDAADEPRSDHPPRAAALALGGVFAVGSSLLFNAHYATHCRSTLARAERIVRLHPEDPRAIEILAAAYDFGRNSPTLTSQQRSAIDWKARWRESTDRAVALAEAHPEVFKNPQNRAAFHRRQSFVYWKMPAPEESLHQALRAADFDPNHRLTWLRLAYAYQSLARFEEALRAYQRLDEQLRAEADAPGRAVAYISHADLLIQHGSEYVLAGKMYREALRDAEITAANRVRATLGLARCEVMAGQGAEGERLASRVLAEEPANLEAVRVLALYHLRSHHWSEAEAAYARVLRALPADYEALRGYQEVCGQTGRWLDAVFPWRQALRVEPDDRAFLSFYVWSLACAGVDNAGPEIERLLESEPDNPLACLAMMLQSIRAGDIHAANRWIQRAGDGRPIPLAREAARAEAALRLLVAQVRLPPEANVARAALMIRTGSATGGIDLLQAFVRENPDSPAREAAERMIHDAFRPASTAPREP